MNDGRAHLALLQTRPTTYSQINTQMEKATTKFAFLVALLVITSCWFLFSFLINIWLVVLPYTCVEYVMNLSIW